MSRGAEALPTSRAPEVPRRMPVFPEYGKEKQKSFSSLTEDQAEKPGPDRGERPQTGIWLAGRVALRDHSIPSSSQEGRALFRFQANDLDWGSDPKG
jgi:hypothetical protein